MKNLERAKEIFIFYNDNSCNMARNDHNVYKEYRSYHISEEQEYSWIEEHQIELLKHIENSKIVDSSLHFLCATIDEYETIGSFIKMIEIFRNKINVLDTVSMYYFSRDILNLIDSNHFKKSKIAKHECVVESQKLAIDVLKSLLEKPFTMAPEYFNMSDMRDNIDQQYIFNSIIEDLNYYENIS